MCPARNSDYELSIFLLSSSCVAKKKHRERERESEIYTQRLNIYFGGRDQGIRLAKWSHLRCVDDSNRAGGRER